MSNIYKTTYPTDRYGGNHVVGITIEFVDLKKHRDGPENMHWAWYLILDGKRDIVIWKDEDDRGRRYDGGCYNLEKDEFGNRVLGKPIDYEEREIIEEYLDKEWPLAKRENYILKKSLSKDTEETFGGLLDVL
jgi:hypothetical protein